MCNNNMDYHTLTHFCVLFKVILINDTYLFLKYIFVVFSVLFYNLGVTLKKHNYCILVWIIQSMNDIFFLRSYSVFPSHIEYLNPIFIYHQWHRTYDINLCVYDKYRMYVLLRLKTYQREMHYNVGNHFFFILHNLYSTLKSCKSHSLLKPLCFIDHAIDFVTI